jgi:hypothetical protein
VLDAADLVLESLDRGRPLRDALSVELRNSVPLTSRSGTRYRCRCRDRDHQPR